MFWCNFKSLSHCLILILILIFNSLRYYSIVPLQKPFYPFIKTWWVSSNEGYRYFFCHILVCLRKSTARLRKWSFSRSINKNLLHFNKGLPRMLIGESFPLVWWPSTLQLLSDWHRACLVQSKYFGDLGVKIRSNWDLCSTKNH